MARIGQFADDRGGELVNQVAVGCCHKDVARIESLCQLHRKERLAQTTGPHELRLVGVAVVRVVVSNGLGQRLLLIRAQFVQRVGNGRRVVFWWVDTHHVFERRTFNSVRWGSPVAADGVGYKGIALVDVLCVLFNVVRKRRNVKQAPLALHRRVVVLVRRPQYVRLQVSSHITHALHRRRSR